MSAKDGMTTVMSENAEQIDDVVITGYGGTTNRAKSTIAISTVPKKVFATGSYANPSAALSGAVPGLQVQRNSGQPGQIASITLRGGTNLNGTGAPLIMVDGQLRENLSDINPDDMESMEVLKDAGATALYGARASNGVILITTKRGKAGKTSVTASAKVGVNFQNNQWKVLNAADYLTWGRQGIMESGKYDAKQNTKLTDVNPLGTGNDWKLDGHYSAGGVWSTQFLTEENKHLLADGWKSVKDPVTGKDLIFTDNNYSSVAFNDPAITQDYNVSVSGGNDKGSYFASGGYYNEESFMINNWYRRFSFLFNGDYKITKWLKSESSFSFTHASWRDIAHTSVGNYFARMYAVPPTVRFYNNNNELLFGPNEGDGYPGYNDDKKFRDNNTDRFTFSEGLTFQILKNLSFKINGIWMYDETFKESFNKDFRSGYLKAAKPDDGWNKTRESSAEFDRYLRQTYNGVLQYKENFQDKHNVDVLLGTEFYDQRRVGFNASGKNAPTDDFRDLLLTSTLANARSIDSWHDQYRILSFFGRANYDYDGRYIIGFTFREDGYSTLLGDNRWGFFPGGSAAWVISREKFMEDQRNWLSFLKLRGSYGVNGNVSSITSSDKPNFYELQGAYTTNSYNNQSGFILSTLPATNIRWEKSNTFEIGLDGGFFNNRLNAQIAYYNRTTADLIANVNIPVAQGWTNIKTNNGSVRNHGIEFSVGGTPVQTKDWQWDINGNITWNKNIVVKLPNNGNENNRQGGTQIWDPKQNKLVWVTGMQEGQWLQNQVITSKTKYSQI